MRNRSGLAFLLTALVCSTPALAKKRVLVYTSDKAIQELTGCPWYVQSANRCLRGAVDPQEFFARTSAITHHFQRWETLYRSANETVDGRQWTKKRTAWRSDGSFFEVFVKYRILLPKGDTPFRPDERNPHSALLYKSDGLLPRVYRIRADGTEEELLPMFEEGELLSGPYRRPGDTFYGNPQDLYSEQVEFLRGRKSGFWQDVTSCQFSDELLEEYGVQWGDTFNTVRGSSLVSGYQLQSPEEFFRETDWFLPTWERMAADSISTALSFRANDRSSGDYYIYLADDKEAVRILEIHNPGGLRRIFDYYSDGQTVLVDQESQVTASTELKYPDAELEFFQSGAEVFQEGRWGHPGDPQLFFQLFGELSPDWLERFRSSIYEGHTDNSWRDAQGHTYYVFFPSELRSYALDPSIYTARSRRKPRIYNSPVLSPSWSIVELEGDKPLAVHSLGYTKEREIRRPPPYQPPAPPTCNLTTTPHKVYKGQSSQIQWELQGEASTLHLMLNGIRQPISAAEQVSLTLQQHTIEHLQSFIGPRKYELVVGNAGGIAKCSDTIEVLSQWHNPKRQLTALLAFLAVVSVAAWLVLSLRKKKRGSEIKIFQNRMAAIDEFIRDGEFAEARQHLDELLKECPKFRKEIQKKQQEVILAQQGPSRRTFREKQAAAEDFEKQLTSGKTSTPAIETSREIEMSAELFLEREATPPASLSAGISLLRGQGTQLQAQLADATKKRQAILQQLVALKGTDEESADLLRLELRVVRGEERRCSELLKRLQAWGPYFELHFFRFRERTHPQEREILRVADRLQIVSGQVYQDFETFASVFYALIQDYQFIPVELEERDELYREQYTQFRAGAHLLQDEIRTALDQDGFDMQRFVGRDAYGVFISVAKQKRRLQLIGQGLRKENVEQELEKLRAEHSKAVDAGDRGQAQAAQAQDEIQQLQAELARLEEQSNLLQEQVQSEQQQREEAQAKERELSEQIETLREELDNQLSALRKELEYERSGRRVKRAQFQRFATDLSPLVRKLRERDMARKQAGEQGMRLDPQLGFLMLETRRKLDYEIREGEWPTETLDNFCLTANELLWPASLGDDEIHNFVGIFLHDDGVRIVEALNLYLAGEQPLSCVLEVMRATHLDVKKLANAPVEPVTNDSNRNLLEEWLRPHRDFQRSQYELFRHGRYARTDEVREYLKKADKSLALTEEEWVALWDENSEVFAVSLANACEKAHN